MDGPDNVVGNYGCMRDQRTTQYCAEAADAKARIAELETALQQGVRCECGNDDVCALARRIAELERERDTVATDLVDDRDEWRQRAEKAEREQAACAPYLKDNETPAECIARNRSDVDAALSLLADRTRERDRLRELLDASEGARDHLRAACYGHHAEVARLRSCIDRLPPYDADGFYLDHGDLGRESVSFRDVMDSFHAALRDGREG